MTHALIRGFHSDLDTYLGNLSETMAAWYRWTDPGSLAGSYYSEALIFLNLIRARLKLAGVQYPGCLGLWSLCFTHRHSTYL